MRVTSLVSAVFLVLITIEPATSQIATPEYQSPITLEQHDVTYTVNADGTYTRDETTRIRINIDQAVHYSLPKALSRHLCLSIRRICIGNLKWL